MPRPPIETEEIDFDFHRREAQRLRRAAIDAWLDRLVAALTGPGRRRATPVTPPPPPARPGEHRCPC